MAAAIGYVVGLMKSSPLWALLFACIFVNLSQGALKTGFDNVDALRGKMFKLGGVATSLVVELPEFAVDLKEAMSQQNVTAASLAQYL